MRVLRKINLIYIILLLSLIIQVCKKDYGPAPVVTTSGAWSYIAREVSAGGGVVDSGGLKVSVFGFCWSKLRNPTLRDSHTTQTGNSSHFTATLRGIDPGIDYYLRAYATTKAGTGYGNETIFWASDYSLPEVGTDTVTFINAFSALCKPIMKYDGGDIITAIGVCWSTTIDPTLANPHTIKSDQLMEGLSELTTYYVRGYATNSIGTTYGPNRSFTTLADSDPRSYHQIKFNADLNYGTVLDADFNVYKTIKIGTQTWMAENLRVIHFPSGAWIGCPPYPSIWTSIDGPMYSYYNSDTLHTKINGALYDWHAADTGIICPSGWHVPSINEFNTLFNYLGGVSVSGDKLKETGTYHWLSPNTGADNSSGFTAVPAGRIFTGSFASVDTANYFWTSSENDEHTAPYIIIKYNSDSVIVRTGSKHDGFSIRCLKNN